MTHSDLAYCSGVFSLNKLYILGITSNRVFLVINLSPNPYTLRAFTRQRLRAPFCSKKVSCSPLTTIYCYLGGVRASDSTVEGGPGFVPENPQGVFNSESTSTCGLSTTRSLRESLWIGVYFLV